MRRKREITGDPIDHFTVELPDELQVNLGKLNSGRMLHQLAGLSQYDDHQFTHQELTVLQYELECLADGIRRSLIAKPPDWFLDHDEAEDDRGVPFGIEGLSRWIKTLTRLIENTRDEHVTLWAIGD